MSYAKNYESEVKYGLIHVSGEFMDEIPKERFTLVVYDENYNEAF